MGNTLTVYKREMGAYFNSPIAYVFLAVLLVLSGWFFFSTFFFYNQASLRGILELMPVLFIFFIPAVSMRLLAEEKRSGTLELILTYPLRDSEIVLGKFFASLALLAVGVVLTGTYVLTAAWLGNLDGGVTLAGYAGMLFMGAAYLSIGLYASAITNNQIVAFILGIVLIFLFYYFDKVIIFLPGYLVGLFEYLSVDFHYRNFVRGVIDSRDIIYYLSVITAALMLAGHSLETRKWS